MTAYCSIPDSGSEQLLPTTTNPSGSSATAGRLDEGALAFRTGGGMPRAANGALDVADEEEGGTCDLADADADDDEGTLACDAARDEGWRGGTPARLGCEAMDHWVESALFDTQRHRDRQRRGGDGRRETRE
jgi:hypothetical protein